MWICEYHEVCLHAIRSTHTNTDMWNDVNLHRLLGWRWNIGEFRHCIAQPLSRHLHISEENWATPRQSCILHPNDFAKLTLKANKSQTSDQQIPALKLTEQKQDVEHVSQKNQAVMYSFISLKKRTLISPLSSTQTDRAWRVTHFNSGWLKAIPFTFFDRNSSA